MPRAVLVLLHYAPPYVRMQQASHECKKAICNAYCACAVRYDAAIVCLQRPVAVRYVATLLLACCFSQQQFGFVLVR
jgi:hypothetical protein